MLKEETQSQRYTIKYLYLKIKCISKRTTRRCEYHNNGISVIEKPFVNPHALALRSLSNAKYLMMLRAAIHHGYVIWFSSFCSVVYLNLMHLNWFCLVCQIDKNGEFLMCSWHRYYDPLVWSYINDWWSNSYINIKF